MFQLLVVAQQPRRAARCSYSEVEIAVAVDIGIGGAAPDHRAEQLGSAAFLGNRQKLGRMLGPAIPEEMRGLSVVLGRLDSMNIFFEVAIGAKQVQLAVQVGVEKEQAERKLEARCWTKAGRHG